MHVADYIADLEDGELRSNQRHHATPMIDVA
jgi:hypothetical protein